MEPLTIIVDIPRGPRRKPVHIRISIPVAVCTLVILLLVRDPPPWLERQIDRWLPAPGSVAPGKSTPKVQLGGAGDPK